MEIYVYNWELHERGKWWYIIFITFFAFMIIVSLFTKNFVWAILLFLLLGGYILFWLTSLQKLRISIASEWLKLWDKFFPWNSVNWFLLEIDNQTQTLKNIVFIIWNIKYIHTLNDDSEKIKEFILTLSEYAPLLSDYEQTFIEKLSRRLKL